MSDPGRLWETDGLCLVDTSGADWFPEKATGADSTGNQAKAICARCPVVRECLEAAVDRHEEHGIWGGAGESLRRWLGRVRRSGDPVAWTEAVDQHLAVLRGERAGPVDRNGPGAQHGLRATYNRGCRCRACCWAAADDVAATLRARERRERAA